MLKKNLQKFLIRKFSISPLDDRYSKQLTSVAKSFSEQSLMGYRVNVEINWLQYLLRNKVAQYNKESIDETIQKTNQLKDFKEEDYKEIKRIESTTKHDIKAVEYFIKERLQGMGYDSNLTEFVHFLCTSEDINNLSYSLMLKNYKEDVLENQIQDLIQCLLNMIDNSKDSSMLSRTHGQAATPTTMGKELANFTYRINLLLNEIQQLKFKGKMNGAVGNYNGHYVIDQNKNWPEFVQNFIEQELKLVFNGYTTQIEPHDSMVSLFSKLNHLNYILIGMCQDLWHYISKGYFILKTNDNEVGSSIMPHKVNPIDFENAEANLGLSSGLLEFFCRKLPISRFQRDLSDSSVLRNIGTSLGHQHLSIKNIQKGLLKLTVNEKLMLNELDQHWEVLAEPIQQILRMRGYEGAYELLKKETRGKKVTKELIQNFVQNLDLDQQTRQKLLDLTPQNYTGAASLLAQNLKAEIKK